MIGSYSVRKGTTVCALPGRSLYDPQPSLRPLQSGPSTEGKLTIDRLELYSKVDEDRLLNARYTYKTKREARRAPRSEDRRMAVYAAAAKVIAVSVISASALYIHLRGKVRHRFTRQLTDHSTFLAAYNALIYLSSAVPATPYLEVQDFADGVRLRENWTTIRDEALALFRDGHIRAATKYNDLGFNSFFRSGWRRFYLKWYDEFLPSAQSLCPKTVELLTSCPTVHAAIFALLEPGGRLVTHRDPFAGSLRYHLGLSTPNSPDCYIVVDGQPYYWRDGEAVVFDETYIHTAENKTNQPRVILFADVERPLRNHLVRAINRFVIRHFVKATASQNLDHEPVGVLNRLFSGAYRVRLLGKRIKQYNKALYYAIKYALFGVLLYLIFF